MFVVAGSCLQPQTYAKPEAAIIVFELLMMGGVSPETCWEITKHWNNKFYYTVASCWFFPYDLHWDKLSSPPMLQDRCHFEGQSGEVWRLSNKSDGFSEIGKHDKGNVSATFFVLECKTFNREMGATPLWCCSRNANMFSENFIQRRPFGSTDVRNLTKKQ